MASCFPFWLHWWWRFRRYCHFDRLRWWPSRSTNCHRWRMHCWRRMPILHFHQSRNELRWRPSRCRHRLRWRNRQRLRCLQMRPSQRLPTRRQISVSKSLWIIDYDCNALECCCRFWLLSLKRFFIMNCRSSIFGQHSRASSWWPISTWHAVGLIVILTHLKHFQFWFMSRSISQKRNLSTINVEHMLWIILFSLGSRKYVSWSGEIRDLVN